MKEEDGKKTVTVTATLREARTTDIMIPVTISTNATYYNLSRSALSIGIDATDMSGKSTFTLTPVNNETWNGDQKITVTLGSGSDLVLRDDATITVVDDEKLPAMALSTDPEKVAEGGGAQRVTVTATLKDGVLLPTATTVSVTIKDNADQYALSGTELSIRIPANQESGSGSVTITPVSDNIFEAAATSIAFTGKAQLVADVDGSKREASASVTITDDDHQFTLSASPAVVDKGEAKDVTVKATLVRPAVREVMIQVMVPDAPASEYTVAADPATALNINILTITVGAGKSEGMATLTVTPAEIFGANNEFYNPTVTIPLTIAASSNLVGLGTEISVVDSKVLPGLKLAVIPTEIVEGDTAPGIDTPCDGDGDA